MFKVSSSPLSDHHGVTFNLDMAKPPLPTKELTYRRLKAIDMDAFTSDIKHSRLFSLETEDVDELADAYNAVLSEVLDKHAPEKKKTVTIHPVAPWYNDDIGAAKKERRHAERVWRTSGLTVHEQIYHDAKLKVTEMIANSKQQYYKERINSADDSQKALFACVKELLHGNRSTGLPSCDSAHDLSERIATFFKDKSAKSGPILNRSKRSFPLNKSLRPCFYQKMSFLPLLILPQRRRLRKLLHHLLLNHVVSTRYQHIYSRNALMSYSL